MGADKRIMGECSRCRRRYHVNKLPPTSSELATRTYGAVMQSLADESSAKSFSAVLRRHLHTIILEAHREGAREGFDKAIALLEEFNFKPSPEYVIEQLRERRREFE